MKPRHPTWVQHLLPTFDKLNYYIKHYGIEHINMREEQDIRGEVTVLHHTGEYKPSRLGYGLTLSPVYKTFTLHINLSQLDY